MVECDLRLSFDGVPVCFHDDDLLRMSGLSDRVCDLTAKDLAKKASAPTLEECLLDKNCPEFWNLEIKSGWIYEGELEKRVAEVIKETGSEKRVMISSFNPFSLMRMAFLLPNVPRALLVSEEDHPKNKVWLREMWLAPLLSIHMLNLDHEMVNPALMRKLKERQLKFSVWTVNGSGAVENWQKNGATSVISDQWLK